MRYTANVPAPTRHLTADQHALNRWFAAMLRSGRGPKSITKLEHALMDMSVAHSFGTLAKAANDTVCLPAKYVVPLAELYKLTPEEAQSFSEVAAMAHTSAEVAAYVRRAWGMPDEFTVPSLKLNDDEVEAVSEVLADADPTTN